MFVPPLEAFAEYPSNLAPSKRLKGLSITTRSARCGLHFGPGWLQDDLGHLIHNARLPICWTVLAMWTFPTGCLRRDNECMRKRHGKKRLGMRAGPCLVSSRSSQLTKNEVFVLLSVLAVRLLPRNRKDSCGME